ncbi:TadE family protein [Atopobiaceae bacterium 24-176]
MVTAATEDKGQSTVEAAVVLPCILFCVALLAQPLCILYTRSVMASAAGEAARLLATAPSSSKTDVEAFVRRRLAAVPSLGVFHVGGEEDWEVSLGDAGAPVATVRISGFLEPLPLFGPVVRALTGERLLAVSVEAAEKVRPSWLGGSYAEWVSIWS